MSSGVSRGRLTNKEINMITLPLYQRSIVVGLLLSDGWLSFGSAKSTNARLGFEQSYSRFEYVWFVFNFLSSYCSSLPSVKSRSRHGVRTYSLGFSTRSLPYFTKLRTMFYLNNVKRIPHNIYDLLTPVALAHLIMGDGTVASRGLRICTDSFSIPDVVLLLNVLMIKYRLDCTLHLDRNKPRIYISAKSMKLLASIVKPYTVPSMYYKLTFI